MSDYDWGWNNEQTVSSTHSCENTCEITRKSNANQWIPCEERLPSEEDGAYLVSTLAVNDKCGVDIAYYSHDLHRVDKYDFPKKKSGWYGYDHEYGYYERDEIVAWMPLPKPYERRTEG